jgi:hypothetical protein
MFGGGIQRTFADVFRDSWRNGPSPDELLGKVGDKMEKYRDAQKKAADEAARWRAELAAAQNAAAFNRARDAIGGIKKRIREASERGYEDMTHRTGQVDKASEWAGMDVQGRADYVDALGKLPKGAAELKRLAKQEERQDFLTNVFGPIDKFAAYKTAFEGLNTAVTSSMQAWISGSMSLGQAIKKGIADALGSMSSQLAVEALKHTAYAIASAAFGDARGAALHGASAAAFGAGAAAAAVAAKKLGASVAGGGAAKAASGGSTSPGGGGGTGGGGQRESSRPIQVFIGDHFNGDERRKRQIADEAIARAIRDRDG